MATWLAVALVVVTALSLLVGTVVTLVQALRLGEDVLASRSRTLLAVQADAIERFLLSSERNAALLAGSGTVRAAAERFGEAYEELGDAVDEVDMAAATDDVLTWYRDDIVPPLGEISGEPVGARALLPASGRAVYLQSLYSVVDPLDPIPVAERVDAEDGSAWSRAHAELHPTLAAAAARLQFDDVLLIDPETGIVQYTVAKLPELGTSLAVGPYSGSVLARGFRQVRDAAEQGAVLTTDVAFYGPAGGAPASFVITPVYDGSRLLAVLAGRISTDEIDRIMTANERWEDAGFGETGETFLVGADGRMRSVSRAFVEDPDRYLRTVADAGTATPRERAAMRATGTTVSAQEVFTEEEMRAISSGEARLVDPVGYLGDDVRTSVEPVETPGLDWTVTAQVAAQQFQQPLVDYRRAAVVVAVIVVILLTFVAVVWARRTFAPVRAISDRLDRVRAHDDTGPADVSPAAAAEFADLARSVDEMVGALSRRRAEVEGAIAERRATMRALLPASVAERLDAGDRHVVEEIGRASVAVLIVNGLGRLIHADTSSGREQLDRIVGALDPLAERHGLVRVKLLGDAYFAGCGLDRPYLDHAVRALAFAQEAHDVISRLTDAVPTAVRLSAGIDSGPVVVGLSGSAMMVFDMWGETSTTAHHLAQTAQPGATLLSARTRALLPQQVRTAAYDGDGEPAWTVADPVPSAAGEASS